MPQTFPRGSKEFEYGEREVVFVLPEVAMANLRKISHSLSLLIM